LEFPRPDQALALRTSGSISSAHTLKTFKVWAGEVLPDVRKASA
jgi:hypothetical protein